MQKFKENFVLVDESKNTDDDIQGDSDAFNLKFSPRTKRRIKRNLQMSSQLKNKNFHEKMYGKLLHGSKAYYQYTTPQDDPFMSTVSSGVNFLGRRPRPNEYAPHDLPQK